MTLNPQWTLASTINLHHRSLLVAGPLSICEHPGCTSRRSILHLTTRPLVYLSSYVGLISFEVLRFPEFLLYLRRDQSDSFFCLLNVSHSFTGLKLLLMIFLSETWSFIPSLFVSVQAWEACVNIGRIKVLCSLIFWDQATFHVWNQTTMAYTCSCGSSASS